MTESMPASVTCRSKAGIGFSLFSKAAIEAGESIFSLPQPLVTVLDTARLQDTCVFCCRWLPEELPLKDEGTDTGNDDGAEGSARRLRACMGCKIVKYCSKGCQSRSWKKDHRSECKIYAQLYPKVLPNTVRAVLRFLSPTAKESEREAFLALRPHLPEFQAQQEKNAEGLKTWETIELMSQAAKEYSGTKANLSQIQGMIARILINSHTLTTPTLDPLGLCLALPTALINHSCEPNAHIVFSVGLSLHLRSLRTIAAEEEITLSYIDATRPTYARQAELGSRYFFTCKCPLCEGKRTFRNIPDQLPTQEAQAVESQAMDLESQALASSSSSGPLVSLSKTESALASLLKVSPPYQQPAASIRHRAFLYALSAQNWPRALYHALKAYFYIDPIHYPTSWHPVRLVRKWVLLKLVTQIAGAGTTGMQSPSGKSADVDWRIVCEGLWREVWDGVKKSHGPDSDFAREITLVGQSMGVETDSDDRGERSHTGNSSKGMEVEWTKLRKIADADD